MKRLAIVLLCALLIGAAALTVRFGYAVWGDWRDNADIRALASGKRTALRDGADVRAIHGRILFLAWRDRLQEAQDLLPLMRDTPPALVSDAHFVIGNARMRAAFGQIETGLLEDATPEVNLAKAAYRAALRANPANWDAKVNLDLAMRLVRDLPRPEAEGESDPQNRPRRLWTDLPGLPRGLP